MGLLTKAAQAASLRASLGHLARTSRQDVSLRCHAVKEFHKNIDNAFRVTSVSYQRPIPATDTSDSS
jgi:hypothetical protein